MGGRKLTVYRKGYRRRDGTFVHPATYKIKDRGAPGRGKKVFTVKGGVMTEMAHKLGYLGDSRERIIDIPYHEMDDFARDLAAEVGARRAWGMFHAQVVYRKRSDNGFKKKMVRARDTVSKEFSLARD